MDTTGGKVTWILDADNSRLTSTLNDSEKQVESTAGSIETTTRNLSKSVSNVFSDIANTVSSTFKSTLGVATTSIIALGAYGVKSANDLESLQISMNGLTKSTQLGAQALADAYAYAKKAPFQLVEVAATTKELLAYGRQVSDINDDLAILGNVSITTGINIQSLGSIYGEVSASGKLFLGVIRQLTEDGVAILPALEKELGKTADQVQDMATAGEISFDQFKSALSGLVDPTILEQLNNTLGRQLDRLKGSYRILSGALVGYTVDTVNGFTAGQNGIYKAATSFTKNLADTLRAPEVLTAMNNFGNLIAPVIQHVADLFAIDPGTGLSKAGSAIAGFLNIITSLGPAAIPLLGALVVSSTSLLEGIPYIGPALAPIGDGFNNAVGGLLNFLNPFNDLNVSIPKVNKTLDTLGGAISGGIPILSLFGSTFRGQNGNIASWASSVQGAVTSAIDFSAPISQAAGFAATFGGAIKNTTNNVKEAAGAIPLVDKATDFLGDKFAKTAISAKLYFDEVNPIPSLMSRLKDTTSDVTSVLSEQTSTLQGVAGAVKDFLGNFAPLLTILPSAETVTQGLGGGLDIVGQGLGIVTDGLGAVLGVLGTVTKVFGGFLAVVAVIGAALAVGAGAIGFFADQTGTTADQVSKKISDMSTNIINSINGFVSNLPEMIHTAMNSMNDIVSTISQILPQLIKAGGDIVSAVVTGVLANMPNLIVAINQIIEAGLTNLKTLIPLVFNAGLQLVQGLVLAIGSVLPLVIATITVVINGLVSTIVAALPQLVQSGLDLFESILRGLITGIPEILKAATDIISGLISALTTAIPLILSAGAQIIDTLLYGITSNLPTLLQDVSSLIIQLVGAIATILPQVIQTGGQILLSLVNGIITNLPMIINTVTTIVTTLVTTIATLLPQLLLAGVNILVGLITGIVAALPQIITAAVNLVGTLLNTIVSLLPQLLQAGVQIVITLIEGVLDNLPGIITAAAQLVTTLLQTIVDNLPMIIQAAVSIITTLVTTLTEGDTLTRIIDAITLVITTLIDTVATNLPLFIKLAIQLIGAIINGLIIATPQLLGAGLQLAIALIGALGTIVKDALEIGKHLVEGLINGIIGSVGAAVSAAKNVASNILSSIKNVLGIHSPSREAYTLGDYLMQGLTNGISTAGDQAIAAAGNVAGKVLDTMNGAVSGNLSMDANASITSQMIPASNTGTISSNNLNQSGTVVNNYNITLPNVKDADDFAREFKLATVGRAQ